LIERSLADLPVRDGTVTIHTKPYEIKSVKVDFAALGDGKATNVQP
jgi:hypothetical protein